MTDDDFPAILRALDGLRQELATVRAHTDGIPLLGSAIENIRRDVRLVRAAVNDIGNNAPTP